MKFVKIYNKIEEILLITILLVMGLILAYQVFSRYVLDDSLVWSEEAARYLMVWLAYIGLSYGIKQDCHIRMSVVYKRFNPTMQKIVTFLTNSVILYLFINIFPSAIKYTKQQFIMESSAMQIPLSVIFVALPVGIVLASTRLIVQNINMLIDIFKNGKKITNGEGI